jgi:predicted metal-dependent TIM-barrel fold hydrolase
LQSLIYGAALLATMDGVLSGAIDFDVHAGPDMVPRKVSVAELARISKAAGMKGFMVRSHMMPTVTLARLVSESYPEMLIAGNVVLNENVGGLNPVAARVAIEMGARAVFMPTFDSVNHIAKMGPVSQKDQVGISILDQRDELLPQVTEILGIVADADVVLGSGELSAREILSLVKAAKKQGVKRMVVNHPEYWIIDISGDDQKEIVDRGAYIEHSFVFTSSIQKKTVSFSQIAGMIKRHGHERCIMATDCGQPPNPTPPEALETFALEMKKEGIPQQHIDVMMKENPLRLLQK